MDLITHKLVYTNGDYSAIDFVGTHYQCVMEEKRFDLPSFTVEELSGFELLLFNDQLPLVHLKTKWHVVYATPRKVKRGTQDDDIVKIEMLKYDLVNTINKLKASHETTSEQEDTTADKE